MNQLHTLGVLKHVKAQELHSIGALGHESAKAVIEKDFQSICIHVGHLVIFGESHHFPEHRYLCQVEYALQQLEGTFNKTIEY